MIPAVNFHLWEPCNMRCQFCFATFQDVKKSILPKGHLPREQAVAVVKHLAEFGFEKITFAGGEPTLCSWLPELISTAKEAGLTTMIVTNGTNLTDSFLKENQDTLDWITLSVDSLSATTNIETGRAVSGKRPIDEKVYYDLVDRIKHFGYSLKINTVVSSKNANEDMSEFIAYASPHRWKIFQVLPIAGQNDVKVNNLEIPLTKFEHFVAQHQSKIKNTIIVPETNKQMMGTYAMVDPAGRFFDNSSGTHVYSEPILNVGCQAAMSTMKYSTANFEQRGGIYDWKITKLRSA